MCSSSTCITVGFSGRLTLRLAPKQGLGFAGRSRVLCSDAVGVHVSSRACLCLLSGVLKRLEFPLDAAFSVHEQDAKVWMSHLKTSGQEGQSTISIQFQLPDWGGGERALKGTEVEPEADCYKSQPVNQEYAGCHWKAECWFVDRYE